jgi:hypothetical protein
MNQPFLYKDTTNNVYFLNTDISFSSQLPRHKPTSLESNGISSSHGLEYFGVYNSDDYLHPAQHHSKKPHIHNNILDDFSWAVVTPTDSLVDQHKKKIIKTQPSSQYGCGSCWAISLADTMSDCLVVSGAVNWQPNISATYIMMRITDRGVHNYCGGGNPALAARYLEGVGVADTSCVDYSWCTDNTMCSNVNSASHFDAHSLITTLNNTIPRPAGCYFYNVDKFMYKLDTGSEAFFIDDNILQKTTQEKNTAINAFRNTVKSHILDFGPVIGGFVVLKNFLSGEHTDPTINEGVYLDRADYTTFVRKGDSLSFSDNNLFQNAGLHAVSIVGWGIAKNIQYDTNKWGDVPYWHCRNSWGSNWGKQGGFFKCAMYPFNTYSQFDKQIITAVGGAVGSIIFIKATQKPEITKYDQISNVYNNQIQTKLKPTSYYQGDTVFVSNKNKHMYNQTYSNFYSNYIFITVIVLVFFCVLIFRLGGY